MVGDSSLFEFAGNSGSEASQSEDIKEIASRANSLANEISSISNESKQSPRSISNIWTNFAMDVFRNQQNEQNQPTRASSTGSNNSGSQDTNEKCWVCGCVANGRHYGVMACFGCKGFFRRTVQGGKEYNCRHQRQCVIDENDRNCCRACRFQKCIDVGMDSGAIQPDRDKTGKQRNPRRANYPLHRSPLESNSIDLDVLKNLLEVERKLKTLEMQDSLRAFTDLSAAVQCSTTVCSRTPLNFEGTNGTVTWDNLHRNMLRLTTYMIDYINSMRPLADLSTSDKELLIREKLPSFILLVIAFESAPHMRSLHPEAQPAAIYLPLGDIIPEGAQFSSLTAEQIANLDIAKLSPIQRIMLQLDECLLYYRKKIIRSVAQMEFTEEEKCCIKGISVMDPSIIGLSSLGEEKMIDGEFATHTALHYILYPNGRPNRDERSKLTQINMILQYVNSIAPKFVEIFKLLRMSGLFTDSILFDILFGQQ